MIVITGCCPEPETEGAVVLGGRLAAGARVGILLLTFDGGRGLLVIRWGLVLVFVNGGMLKVEGAGATKGAGTLVGFLEMESAL
jgi:hypothetical protein